MSFKKKKDYEKVKSNSPSNAKNNTKPNEVELNVVNPGENMDSRRVSKVRVRVKKVITYRSQTPNLQ